MVVVFSADVRENGSVTVAAKVPRYASGGEQEDHPSGYLLLEASGNTFDEAAAMLNATTPHELNYSQVREIMIGEKAAEDPGFLSMLEKIDQLPRFRCSAALIVCRGEGRALASAQKPFIGERLSRYADSALSHYAGKGYTPDTDLCAALRDMGYGLIDPMLILGALNDFSSAQSIGNNPFDEKAGSLPRSSPESMEVFGAAVTSGSRVCGYLTGYETALLKLAEGRLEGLTLKEKDETITVSSVSPAKLTVICNTDPVKLSVSLPCRFSYPSGHPPDEQAAAARIEHDLTQVLRYLQELNSDALGFGRAALCLFPTAQAWDAFQWREKYRKASLRVILAPEFTER